MKCDGNKNKRGKPHFRLNFKRNKKNKKIKAQPKFGRKVKLISEIIPTYPYIRTKIQKKKEDGIKYQPTVETVNDSAKLEHVRPVIDIGMEKKS